MGRVAIVTGGTRGIGEAICKRLKRQGHTVIANYAGNDEKARAFTEATGIPSYRWDVGDHEATIAGCAQVEADHGPIDIVVNNAGITRDRMLFNMTDEDWDAVIAVHLRGHFLLTRNAATYWRAKAKDSGGTVFGRIINTSSEAGLSGSVGQSNYAAAKAGITALTLTAARALGRYGVRANVICPRARTAMTAGVFGDAPELADGQIDPLSPEHVVSLVRFLASPAAADINGQVFIVYGPKVTLVAAPTAEHRFAADGDAWDLPELSTAMRDYFADRDPERMFGVIGLMGD